MRFKAARGKGVIVSGLITVANEALPEDGGFYRTGVDVLPQRGLFRRAQKSTG